MALGMTSDVVYQIDLIAVVTIALTFTALLRYRFILSANAMVVPKALTCSAKY